MPFELLIREGFQAGLPWKCMLNRRKHFRQVCESYDLRTTLPLSDQISKNLKKFVCSTVIYSYLQAIEVIIGHGSKCDCHKIESAFIAIEKRRSSPRQCQVEGAVEEKVTCVLEPDGESDRRHKSHHDTARGDKGRSGDRVLQFVRGLFLFQDKDAKKRFHHQAELGHRVPDGDAVALV